jgi:cob(I)alamin adenosyltransferase
MSPAEKMQAIDTLLAHVWMVRAFLKHCDEAQEDEELRDIQRELYDYMLALGEPLRQHDAEKYLRTASKKYSRLRRAAEHFSRIQPDVSTHTNFQMAARSLSTAVQAIGGLLQGSNAGPSAPESETQTAGGS